MKFARTFSETIDEDDDDGHSFPPNMDETTKDGPLSGGRLDKSTSHR